jgi:hypothetical protein
LGKKKGEVVVKKTFRVTRKHIEKAVEQCARSRNREGLCPIAQALHEQGYPDALVCSPDIQLLGVKGGYVRSPRSVLEFIRKFDEHKSVQSVRPFEFTLAV